MKLIVTDFRNQESVMKNNTDIETFPIHDEDPCQTLMRPSNNNHIHDQFNGLVTASQT
jgi:hypothetical protein